MDAMRDKEFVFANEEAKKDKVEVSTSWCVADVRAHLGDSVSHMTNKEIMTELNNLAKSFHEECVGSGWNVIMYGFTIKEKDNDE